MFKVQWLCKNRFAQVWPEIEVLLRQDGGQHAKRR
jgi:hypothetical protein